jgi:ATP-dependent protease ClpP protease subunit
MRQLIDITLSAEAETMCSSQKFVVFVRDGKNDAPAEIGLFKSKNDKPDAPEELPMYGDVGDPWAATDARSVGAFLRGNRGRDVIVRINSPGGLAFDGITIHNALLAHDGKVTTVIDGMAGSAASIIAVAGNPCQIYENAQFFAHRAAAMAIGNVDVMADAQDWLSKIDESIARTYKARTGKALDKILAMMKGKVDGTLFTAREAKEYGLGRRDPSAQKHGQERNPR